MDTSVVLETVLCLVGVLLCVVGWSVNRTLRSVEKTMDRFQMMLDIQTERLNGVEVSVAVHREKLKEL